MSAADEKLDKVRKSYKRLRAMLEGDARSVLIFAEIAHEAAHLMEHASGLDSMLSKGTELPSDWVQQTEPPALVEEVPQA